MNKSLFVKPSDPDLVVRDPASRKALAADGGTVPDTPYWRRRLKDGDVVKASRPKPDTRKKES